MRENDTIAEQQLSLQFDSEQVVNWLKYISTKNKVCIRRNVKLNLRKSNLKTVATQNLWLTFWPP